MLPIYHETNPLSLATDHYGLDWDNDVLPITCSDHNIDYGQTRKWIFGKVVIIIYRLDSGNYELTTYQG